MCTDHAQKLCMCLLGSNSAHGESKLSTRGVQTQHVVPPPTVHCPPTPNATCLTRSPHHHAALAAFALAARQSPSPHTCLTRPPHHHPALTPSTPPPPVPLAPRLPRPPTSPSRRPCRLRPCRSPVALAPHLPHPLASP